jgi:conserved oligomeric Golgi complex subunit 3
MLHWEHPIATPEQFHDWLAKIERSVARSQESHFHAHLDTVKGLLDTCNRLLADVETIEAELDSMLEGWRSVEESGKSLKEGCEKLLEEKVEFHLVCSEAIS